MKSPLLIILHRRKYWLAVTCLLLFIPAALAIRSSGNSSKDTDRATSPAAQNAILKYELDWVFGGKSQRGWYLYVPLIRSLIGTEDDADGDLFAEQLSRWQRSAGLSPTGVLDGKTWSKMISVFQSPRIKARGKSKIPSRGSLILPPATEFYDPLRPDELRLVERQAYAAYKRMLEAASADTELQSALGPGDQLAPAGDVLKIISAYRSPAYQATLRKVSPKPNRAQVAVHSPHFSGRALDLFVGGDPVSTVDQNRELQINTPVYRWLVKNAPRFGFYPYFYEPWHWEFRH